MPGDSARALPQDNAVLGFILTRLDHILNPPTVSIDIVVVVIGPSALLEGPMNGMSYDPSVCLSDRPSICPFLTPFSQEWIITWVFSFSEILAWC